MRRGLLVVEWPVTIPGSEQRDFDVVVGEFMRDASGILNWLIAGALDYLKNGLVVSDETRAMTKDYFDEMDPLARFVRDCSARSPATRSKPAICTSPDLAHLVLLIWRRFYTGNWRAHNPRRFGSIVR